MGNCIGGKFMAEINEAIRWWENQLTADERATFLQGKLWSGSVDERHERLLGFYRKKQGIN